MSGQLFTFEDDMRRTAYLSDDGTCRYTLGRYWGHGGCTLGWVMLNPSTADGAVDDPTIRRCLGFARRDGYEGITVTNLYAHRATDPKDLRRMVKLGGGHSLADDRVHRRGVLDALIPCRSACVAWGANPVPETLVRSAMTLLRHAGHDDPLCLGTTKSGAPRHPLMVRADEPMVSWVGGAL